MSPFSEFQSICIGETRRLAQERMKEHERDVHLTRTQTFAVSEHNKTGHCPDWKSIKRIDRNSYWYSRRVKTEAIQIRLHPNNINKDRNTSCLDEQHTQT